MSKKLIIILMFLIWVSGHAQTRSTDSLYRSAKIAVGEKKYAEAQKLLERLLVQDSTNSDYLLLMGNLNAWQHQWDQALYWLQKAKERSPKYKEIALSIVRVKVWSGKMTEALDEVNRSLSLFPNERDLLFEKAKILISLDRKKEAAAQLMQLLSLYPMDREASELLQTLRKSGMVNKLSLAYDLNYFQTPYFNRWHLFSLAYERRTKIGSLIAKINTTDFTPNTDLLFASNTAIQYEIEAYPRISKRDYLYLDYGYSPNLIMPRNRAGMEWFHSFPWKLEASIGFRYLDFNNTSNPKEVWIYTPSLSKYYRDYLFSLRGYFSPKEVHFSQSYLLSVRRYSKNPLNYVTLSLGYGISPDIQYLSSLYQSNGILNQQSIKLGIQRMMGSQWYTQSEIGVQSQEYLQSKYRTSFDLLIKVGLFF